MKLEPVDWRPWYEVWLPVALLVTGAFVAFPVIDLGVSGFFGDAEAGFPLTGSVSIRMLRGLLLAATGGVVLATLGAALLGLVSATWRPLLLRDAMFVLYSFALGPGLLVNGVIKRMSGRVRPMNIDAFGGIYSFQPAFDFSGPCGSGCSFVSAETAAVAVAMTCLVLVFGPKLADRPRAMLRIGVVAAVLAVAAIRIALGAHFLSDVVYSLLLISAIVPALHILFGMGRLTRRARPSGLRSGLDSAP